MDKIGKAAENKYFLKNNIKYELNEEVMMSIRILMSIISAKDTYTYQHVKRVAKYARLIAKGLMLSEENGEKLIYGAYIHDIGKININKDTLIKKAPLNNDEWEEIKRHSKYGWEMVNKINCFKGMEDISNMVLYLHERYDGGGYPKGLEKKDIPYLTRILTVIDSFDAMTSARPYNNKKSYKEGIEELEKCAGTQFDPEIVESFSRVITEKIFLTI